MQPISFDSPDESSLLSYCLDGKPEAWDLFVKRYSRLVYHSIFKTLESRALTLAREDIEDLFNDVFLSFLENNYKKLRQFEARQGCTLASWIRLISIRKTIDFLRSRRQHLSLDGEDDQASAVRHTLRDARASAYEEVEFAEKEAFLKAAMEELPRSDRLFMRFYYEKELAPEEIAKIMHVSVNTVYSKKSRIRDKLGKILEVKGYHARDSE